VLAPQQGISHDQKGRPTALVVGTNNTVEPRLLETDRAVGDQWLVISGLKAGDRIVVEGLQAARPGATVVAEEYRPQPEEKAERQANAKPAAPAK
jgi:membrane fusion protein, multidrug efflux system